jgi:bifunctional non-homologous end joining protein LigD
MRPLAEYVRKRNFRATPEPKGKPGKTRAPIFVVQRHAARRLHFDFRLEINGALASWAVPKGPPEERGEKRLAIHVEDHPIDYAKFEGEIPKGNYGAGQVQIWDAGTFEVEGNESAADQVKRGDLKFSLSGQRLNGRFALVKMRHAERGNEWLLIRKTDADIASVGAGVGGAKTPVRSLLRSVRAVRAENYGELPGAVKAAMPEQISVALATLADKPFSSPDWLYEIKWDGERSLAFIRDGEVELRARSGRDITAEYPELKELAKRVNARKAILDGEIVVLDGAGRSDFSRIQQRFGVVRPSASLMQSAPVTYYAFDLLYCDGYDLRGTPLEQRKELLRKLLGKSERVRFSDHEIEKGVELFEVAKNQRLEGIIAKRRDSPYTGRRSSLWLKFKIVQDMDVVIGGWTAPRKTREHFGALLMGFYDDKGQLEYIGSVGTGFTQETLDRTFKELSRLEIESCPFRVKPKLPEAGRWVKPELVARVKYGHWTQDKKLRQPVFLGFQEDRKASDCRFEDETVTQVKQTSKKHRANEKVSEQTEEENIPSASVVSRAAKDVAISNRDVDLETELASGKGESIITELDGKRLSLTNLNKVLFPKPRLRKRDILYYYFRVAPYILPFLKDRPLVLKRYPNGIDAEFFFQKEAPASHPEWIKTVEIDSKERGGKMPYFLAEDRADLLYLTNLGCIDHNPWSSRYDDETHPDYIFFDLDPTDGTPFDVVLTVARAINKKLADLGVVSYLKTSGASGFHIYIPLKREYSYEEVRLFAGAIGQRVQAELPRLVTFERTVSKRAKGTVLIDSLQNARGKPLAAVYSLRPFPGAPVSAPVSVRELKKEFIPADFNIETIFKRLKRVGDLWADFWQKRQRLQDAVERAG